MYRIVDRPLLHAIVSTLSNRIAICSAGASSREHDSSIRAFKQLGIDLNPCYPIINDQSFINGAEIVEGAEFEVLRVEKLDLDTVKARAELSLSAAVAKIPGCNPGTTFSLEKGVWVVPVEQSGEVLARITIKPDTTWIVNVGGDEKRKNEPATKIKIKAQEFLSYYQVLRWGNNKLLSLFRALDEARLYVKVNDHLRKIGIVEIISPAGYQEIRSEDVVFLDDKAANTDSIRLAGFHAITVDKDRDDYIRALIVHLTAETIETFHDCCRFKDYPMMINSSSVKLVTKAESLKVINYEGALAYYKLAYIRASNYQQRLSVIQKAALAAKSKPNAKTEVQSDNSSVLEYLQHLKEKKMFPIEILLLQFEFELYKRAYQPSTGVSGLFKDNQDSINRFRDLIAKACLLKQKYINDPNIVVSVQIFMDSLGEFAGNFEILQKVFLETLQSYESVMPVASGAVNNQQGLSPAALVASFSAIAWPAPAAAQTAVNLNRDQLNKMGI